MSTVPARRSCRGGVGLRRGFAAVGVAALAAGAVTVFPAAASASGLSCGMTITNSVTLSRNLNCSTDTTGNALTIGAASITVNLNGYTIIGPGSPANTKGIVNIGHGYPTIEDGAISGFATAVDLEGTSNGSLHGAALTGLSITSSGLAVNSYLLYGASMHNLSISASSALQLMSTSHTNISYNHLKTASGFYDDGHANVLSHNTIDLTIGPGGEGSTGFYFNGSTNDVERANIINGLQGGPGSTGIEDWYSSGQITTKNVLNYLGTGIFESDEDGIVSYNTGYKDYLGIDEEGAIGISYVGNTFNWGHYGIWDYDPSGAVFRDNTTNHNSNAGVYIVSDGVYCGPCTVKLVDNSADYNGWGMYSQIPATGYGNQAAHNTIGNCYNVSCVGTTAPGAMTAPGALSPARHPAAPTLPISCVPVRDPAGRYLNCAQVPVHLARR